MRDTTAVLKIELHGEEADDGRILVRSPDLKGFYFVVNAGEDPLSAMKPTLMKFIYYYLNAEVHRIQRAETPQQFLSKAAGLVPDSSPPRAYSVVAEVAA